MLIAPLEGQWPLRRGQEFVIPNRVQVTALARDALGTADLGEIVRRAAVDATATVELTFNTPWHARLFRGTTETAVAEVAFSAPMPSAPSMGADASILLRTPVHRQSLGSPLVARGAVVGLIAAPDAGWTASTVAAAAARAMRVEVHRPASGV